MCKMVCFGIITYQTFDSVFKLPQMLREECHLFMSDAEIAIYLSVVLATNLNTETQIVIGIWVVQ